VSGPEAASLSMISEPASGLATGDVEPAATWFDGEYVTVTAQLWPIVSAVPHVVVERNGGPLVTRRTVMDGDPPGLRFDSVKVCETVCPDAT
jgi:hypothetical protein